MLRVAGDPIAASTLIQRTEGHFQGADGRTLFGRAWLPESPRAALVLVHGFAEHSGRYEHVGAWLAARRMAVHALDHQGHGLSSGLRCYVRRFPDLLDDVEICIERTRSAHPELPIFVVGHSMGGLITAALACERRPVVAGFVTSGAALLPPPSLSRARRGMLRVLRRIVPKLSLPAGLDPNGLSCDPAVVRAYLDDPLVERRITIALAAEMSAAMRRTMQRGAAVVLPLLALHGAEDPICPPEGSERFAAAVVSGRYLAFPGMRHEIFNEPDREKVFTAILDWIDGILRGTRL
jgi:alpha-beta hydrolase superfamily lysophospholipase